MSQVEKAGSKRKRGAKHSDSETSNDFYYYTGNDSLIGDDVEEEGNAGTDGSSTVELFSSEVALASGATHFTSASQAATATLVNSTDNLAYSWDDLKLGTELGMGALDADRLRMSRGLKIIAKYASAAPPEPLSADHTLQMIHRLRPKACLPRAGSCLFGVVRQTKLENERWYGGDPERFADEVDRRISEKVKEKSKTEIGGVSNKKQHGYIDRAQSTNEPQHKGEGVTSAEKGKENIAVPLSEVLGPIVPLSSIARVYETLCSQDADDGSAYFNGCNYLSASAMVEELRTFENGLFAELEMRERDLMRGSSSLVDETMKDVAPMLGYCMMEDVMTEGRK